MFFQPSGLSPDADWLDNLIDDYYTNLAQGKSEDWVDVYIHAKFGKSLSGQPVFRAFNRDIHVAKNTLSPSRASTQPLIIGFDCGLTPTAVIGQVDYQGRLLVFDAIPSEGMGALRFVREKLKPLLANKYSGLSVIVVADPAGQQRAQTDERTVFDVLRAEGLVVRASRTNSVAARISAVDSYLTRLVDGKPGLLIDPGAVELITAMNGKYRYKINTKGEIADSPEKTHPWSDLADAFQYLALHADGGASFGGSWKTPARPVQVVQYRY